MSDPTNSPGHVFARAEVVMAAGKLARAALVRVQELPSGRVRAEDYITVLAAITGEAALVASGIIDIETSGLTPGQGVFGDRINDVLTGDTTDVRELAPETVVGILARVLVPAVVPLASFDHLARWYGFVAENVGKTAWGHVATSAGEEHRPSILPIQVAFELRAEVDAAQAAASLPRNLRHVPCALALAVGLQQVAGAIEMAIAVPLALEVTFGMAKMAPMPRSVFEKMASERKPN